LRLFTLGPEDRITTRPAVSWQASPFTGQTMAGSANAIRHDNWSQVTGRCTTYYECANLWPGISPCEARRRRKERGV